MAKLNDLTSNKVQERKRQVRTYGTKTDLASTVVERGSTHWAEGSNVHIDGLLGVAGTATVSGVLSVTGTLNASGQINLSGSTAITGPLNVTGTTTIGGNTNITGELNVTGPTTLDGVLDIGGDTTITGTLAVDGPTTISGTLDIQGVATLKSDLNVVTGGKIKAGSVVVDPSGGGRIYFADGEIRDDGGLGMFINNPSAIRISTISTVINGDSLAANLGKTAKILAGERIDLTAPKTWINGQLEATGTSRFPSVYVGAGTELLNNRLRVGSLPNTTVATANVHVDSNGIFYRVVT